MEYIVYFLAILSLQYLSINMYIEQSEMKNILNAIRNDIQNIYRNDIQNMKANITNEIIGSRILLC